MMRGGHFRQQASIPEGKAANSRAVARRLLSYLAPYKLRLAGRLLLTLVAAAFGAGPLPGRAGDRPVHRPRATARASPSTC